MRTYTAETVFGWPWFGIGKIVCYPRWPHDDAKYTMWTLMITQRISLGLHVKCRS